MMNQDDDDDNNKNPIFLKKAIAYMVNSYLNSNLLTKRQAAVVLDHLAKEFYNNQ